MGRFVRLQLFEKNQVLLAYQREMDVIPLHPPLEKGENYPLPLKKGGWEGFYKDGFKRLNCYEGFILL
jgi:hypothetical protein